MRNIHLFCLEFIFDMIGHLRFNATFEFFIFKVMLWCYDQK